METKVLSTLSSARAIRGSFSREELDLNVVYVREDDRELLNVDLEEFGLQKDHVFDLQDHQFDLYELETFVAIELSPTTTTSRDVFPP